MNEVIESTTKEYYKSLETDISHISWSPSAMELISDSKDRAAQIEVERNLSYKSNIATLEIAVIKIEPSLTVLTNEKIMDTVIKEILNFKKNANGASSGIIYIKDESNTIEVSVDLELKDIVIEQRTDIFTTDEIEYMKSYITQNSDFN